MHALPIHFYRRFPFYPYSIVVFRMLLILLFICLHLDLALQFAFVNLYPNKSYILLLNTLFWVETHTSLFSFFCIGYPIFL